MNNLSRGRLRFCEALKPVQLSLFVRASIQTSWIVCPFGGMVTEVHVLSSSKDFHGKGSQTHYIMHLWLTPWSKLDGTHYERKGRIGWGGGYSKWINMPNLVVFVTTINNASVQLAFSLFSTKLLLLRQLTAFFISHYI
jgi:hypothetical protein